MAAAKLGIPARSIPPAAMPSRTAFFFDTARRIPSPVPRITAVSRAVIPSDAVTGQVLPMISATVVSGSW